jgi:hypothetical protein
VLKIPAFGNTRNDVAPFGATSDRRIACADVALNGSHLRICEISPRIAASLLPLQNLANPAIRYATWRIGVHAAAAATVSATKGSCYVSKYKKFFEDELTSTLQEGGGSVRS